MRRGTTPEHRFITDIDLTDAEVIYITYKQSEKTVLEKTIEDITVTEDLLTTKLTQEDTLAFNTGGSVRIQIRARFADGSAIASKVITTTAQEILKEGVI